jgi:hypothetical protein
MGCEVVGCVDVGDVRAAISSCRVFSWERSELRRDCLVAVCVIDTVFDEELDGHESPTAALVLGPTTPYPVVRGVPDETMPLFDCHSSTAAWVIGPK